MRLSFPYYAGPNERFTEDVQLPVPGKRVPFRLAGEIVGECTILSIERVSAEQVLIHVEADIQDDHPLAEAISELAS